MTCLKCGREVTRTWKVREYQTMATHSQFFPLLARPKEMCNRCKTKVLKSGGKIVR